MGDRYQDGYAFPRVETQNTVAAAPGMELRDWFAGQAVPAIVMRYNPNDDGVILLDEDEIARAAYDIADAMVAERERIR